MARRLSMLAGCPTCIAPLPAALLICPFTPSQGPPPSPQHLGSKPPGSAGCQMLTGHSSGHMKLWGTTQQECLQGLAIIRAACSSPVQSLVILPSLQLICSAHLDGHISLHTALELSSHRWAPSYHSDGGLPLAYLPVASFQAHKSGLRQCVAGDTGLISLGAFGSIMVWPESELKAVLKRSDLPPDGRYHCYCLT